MASPRKPASKPAEGAIPKDPAFLERRGRIEQELERQKADSRPLVYYCPISGVNGHVENGRFVKHGLPPGFMFDVEAWEANGKTGAAPLTRIKAPEPQPEG